MTQLCSLIKGTKEGIPQVWCVYVKSSKFALSTFSFLYLIKNQFKSNQIKNLIALKHYCVQHWGQSPVIWFAFLKVSDCKTFKHAQAPRWRMSNPYLTILLLVAKGCEISYKSWKYLKFDVNRVRFFASGRRRGETSEVRTDSSSDFLSVPVHITFSSTP